VLNRYAPIHRLAHPIVHLHEYMGDSIIALSVDCPVPVSFLFQLDQWDSLAVFARQVGNPKLRMECALNLGDFSTLTDLQGAYPGLFESARGKIVRRLASVPRCLSFSFRCAPRPRLRLQFRTGRRTALRSSNSLARVCS
jgi:hypothetical protein